MRLQKQAIEKFEFHLSALKEELVELNYNQPLYAIDFAQPYHNRFRKDGMTPEFYHQVIIARHLLTLADLDNEEILITVGLLHDIVEDHSLNPAVIQSKFGKKVKEEVLLLTKTFEGRGTERENRKYFDRIENSPMASIIKLVDRVENVQTMQGVFTIEKQCSYLDEVDRYFLPMAVRAREKFPNQRKAYTNVKLTLEARCELIKEIHQAINGRKNKHT